VFDWNDARYFLAIARLGSLSAAARHLRVQQTTVGRRLQALESALDSRLFDRTSDGYVATAAGEALVAHAERIEDEALAVERTLAGRQGLIAGQVRVTAPQTFGYTYLVPLVAKLRDEQPDIVVELIADNFALNLSRREADLALRIGRPRQPQLVMRKLAVVADAFYASRGYVERRGLVRPDNLSEHDHIGYGEGYLHGPSITFLAQKLRGARCAAKLNATPGIIAAVQADMGIGLIPAYIGDNDPNLVRVLPGELNPLDLWLVMHRDLRHAARIRVVAEFLVRELSRAAPLLAGRRAPIRGRRR
jgi:DNA-binding transcriptional LysR family regulator